MRAAHRRSLQSKLSPCPCPKSACGDPGFLLCPWDVFVQVGGGEQRPFLHPLPPS